MSENFKFARNCMVYLALLAGWSGHAMAYHPLVTDDTGTQGAGGNQIELGYDYNRSTLNDATATSHGFPVTYTRGITDGLDVFVGNTWSSSPTSGLSNFGVGAKWRFYENASSGLSLGVEPKVNLPVSPDAEQRGLGSSKTCYSTAFLVTQETSFGQLLANVSAGREDSGLLADADNRKNYYQLSVAPVWQATDKLKLALDLGVMTNSDSSQKYRMGFVEVGAIYSPNQSLDLSLGVIRDVMDGPVQNTTVTSEVTWRF
jgi:hypothetical protein